MSRRWLGLALLLSVGVNLGILATLAVERLRDEGDPPGVEAAVDGQPEEGPGGPSGDGPDAGRPGVEEAPEPSVPLEIEHRLDILADRLGLAGEARGRFLGIQRRFFRETLRHRQAVFAQHRALRRELVAPEPDRARVAEALERLSAARDALERSLVETVLESRELLDPVQEAEYLRFVARMRGPGGGGPPGGPPRGRFGRRP